MTAFIVVAPFALLGLAFVLAIAGAICMTALPTKTKENHVHQH